jgi:hypothetical protein
MVYEMTILYGFMRTPVGFIAMCLGCISGLLGVLINRLCAGFKAMLVTRPCWFKDHSSYEAFLGFNSM